MAVPVTPEPLQAPRNTSCAEEVRKYSWPHNVAHAVMMAESRGNSQVVNHNLRTGDHSVGCFQVNILGKLAKNRPSESELKKPHVNVEFAYRMWAREGWNPWSAYKNGSYRKYL